MCAPTPESSGSTTSTLAPLVMSDSASASWVASEPRAFWMVNCELVRPASVNDSFRYGASNSTYRVEETVSGRITATLPLPAEASGLSFDIAEKELFRSPTESDTLLAPPLELDEPDEPDVAGVVLVALELQPAATSSAAAAAAAVSPTRADTEYNGVPRSFTSTCATGACSRSDPYTRP